MNRPADREEWEEALGDQRTEQNPREIGELLDQRLVEEWRGVYRASAEGMTLLKRGGLKDIEAHDAWILGDHKHHGPFHGDGARRVTRLDDLLPLGYGDKLVPVSDERYALVGARPGDVLVFRHAERAQPGDVWLTTGPHGEPVGLEEATGDTSNLERSSSLVLIAHIRRMV
ncbi:hypothetical protein [Deinococcus aestuarii]|uniref:hypothetical protein n=1 Tax=Deinococcus aestuarii TaxID=2774531 RepID=UPI001C0BDA2B|nr:hypothetical protein [Deinococcus aestuarii]